MRLNSFRKCQLGFEACQRKYRGNMKVLNRSFIMRPQPDNLNRFFTLKYLTDYPMLNINPLKIVPR